MRGHSLLWSFVTVLRWRFANEQQMMAEPVQPFFNSNESGFAKSALEPKIERVDQMGRGGLKRYLVCQLFDEEVALQTPMVVINFTDPLNRAAAGQEIATASMVVQGDCADAQSSVE